MVVPDASVQSPDQGNVTIPVGAVTQSGTKLTLEVNAIGGGYVGLEFGQLFRRLGAEVTIVASGGQLLGHEDADVSEEVAKILQQDGIKILFNVTGERLKRAGKQIVMTGRSGNSARTVKASHLLVATGRKPNTDSLHPSVAGIVVDEHGYIKANEKLETNVGNIYVVGDIKGGPAFTHISYDDFRVLRTNILLHRFIYRVTTAFI